MTVYVHYMQFRHGRMVIFHMLADTDDELHAMADAIGVARKWHQKAGTPHSRYDICLSKKEMAIRLGAKQIGGREAAELVNKKRLLGKAISELKQCKICRDLERIDKFFIAVDYGMGDHTVAWTHWGAVQKITLEQIKADIDYISSLKKSPPLRIPFPEHLAPIPIAAECPICGKPLLLNAGEGCEQDANGQWIATEIQLQCTGEPDIDSPEWDDWHRWHYSMPYVDWLPLEQRVLRAVRKKYFFRGPDL